MLRWKIWLRRGSAWENEGRNSTPVQLEARRKKMQEERKTKEENLAARQGVRFADSAAPCLRPVTCAGQINCVRTKKILNRGNEAKKLL
jgi:hypothetical protein